MASFGSDFGQRIDLCGRIREVLRNYPEGTSILKELVQNADDAGASEFVVTLDERQHSAESVVEGLAQFQGPALLAYNNATFSRSDFESLQRLGDSMKREAENSTKTGRFGVGFNSVYHVTELPTFASGSKVVFLDPQARFVPKVDPTNPGKMIDVFEDSGLISQFADQFAGFDGAFGWSRSRSFKGTLFRLPLRTTKQAETSRLSRKAHGLEEARNLLEDFGKQATELLLFLKSIAAIRVCRWTRERGLVDLFSARLKDDNKNLRSIPRHPGPRDYVVSINEETWVVCNQLGGGQASAIAESNPGLRLVPWAGVAARVDSATQGRAYCFCPLPVRTGFGFHTNGFFEVSSNRRDIWQGDEDMTGDGAIRAAWNCALAVDVAAPCLVRCLAKCAQLMGPGQIYDALWPTSECFAKDRPVVWRRLAESATNLAKQSNQLLLWCPSGYFVSPKKAVCLPPTVVKAETTSSPSSELEAIGRVLLSIGVNVVGAADTSPSLRKVLAERVAHRVATPQFCLELLRRSPPQCSREDGMLALRYVVRWIGSQWELLDGLQLVPLSHCQENNEDNVSSFGRFRFAPALPKGNAIENMGFGVVRARAAAAVSNWDLEAAVASLLEGKIDSSTLVFYFVANDDADAALFRHTDTVRKADLASDPVLKSLLCASQALNLVPLSPELALPDLVYRTLPRTWRSKDKVSPRLSEDDAPGEDWFRQFWSFAAASDETLSALAEGLPLVPLATGEIVPLSRQSAVIESPSSHPSRRELESASPALAQLGVRCVHPCIAGARLGAYLFPNTFVGIISAIDTGARRRRGASSVDKFLEFDNKDAAAALRFALSSMADSDASPIPVHLYTAVRSLPFWNVVTGNDYGPLWHAPSFAPAWTPAEAELRVMAAEVTHEKSYLAPSATSVERGLALRLDATDLDRPAFILSHIERGDIDFVALVLRDFSVLHALDPTIKNALSKARFVPANCGDSRYCPCDLFDPTAHSGAVPLTSLLPATSFPSDDLADPGILASLRLLGLKAALDWSAVTLAARKAANDASRGRILLAALEDPILQQRLFCDGEMLSETNNTSSKRGNEGPAASWLGRMVSTLVTDGNIAKDAAKNAEDRKRERQKERADALAMLNEIPWLPVLSSKKVGEKFPYTANQFRSDDNEENVVARPTQCRPASDAWCCSASLRVLDAEEPHSPALLEAFGWHIAVPPRVVAYQLGVMGRSESQSQSCTSPQNITGLVLRLYAALDQAVQKDPSVSEEIRNGLSDAMIGIDDGRPPCVWIGTTFTTADRVAFRGAPAECAPYLHAIPADLAGFARLLRLLGVRDAFGPADFASLLRLLRDNQTKARHVSNDEKESRLVGVALAAARALASYEGLTKERCADLDIMLPDESGALTPARDMVYDDAPWLRDDDNGGLSSVASSMRIVHGDVPMKSAAKLGATSLRRALLDRGNQVSIGATADNYAVGVVAMASTQARGKKTLFGDDVEAAAFGQHEPITRRLRHILEMYPEGAGILCEMVQNADDAGAREVRVVLDLRSRGSRSLLSSRLSEYQGPCLWVQNDAEFSENDWRNLVRVGQGSKLEKPRTTGRFGLGFNSVYHLTDVPQLCSGEYILFLDPHASFVPGATNSQPGLRVRFAGAELRAAFPDQFEPWAYFCPLDDKPFEGTIFRLPLRADASNSDISRRVYSEKDGFDVLRHFRSVADEVLMFLRHVKDIDVSVLTDADEGPSLRRLYRAKAAEMPLGFEWPVFDDDKAGAGGRRAGPADPVAAFLEEDSTASFYGKLAATPESRLPSSVSALRLTFEEEGDHGEHKQRVCDFLLATAIGAGKARDMACDAAHRELKFVPLGGCAVPIGTNKIETTAQFRGRAFCFLPLPARTGLPVHVNGYFELSSNRMDVWHGEDAASTEGRRRSEWNKAILEDAVAVAYALALLRLHQLRIDVSHKFWPIKSPSAPWKACRDAVFRHARRLDCLTTSLDGGKDVRPSLAVAAPSQASTTNEIDVVADLLLMQGIAVVRFENEDFRLAMIDTGCIGRFVSPALVRDIYASLPHSPRPASLADSASVAALLAFALKDMDGPEDNAVNQIARLPFLLLQSGELEAFSRRSFDKADDDEFGILATDDVLACAILRPLEPHRVAHESIAPLAARVARLLPLKTRVRDCSQSDVALAISRHLPREWECTDMVLQPSFSGAMCSTTWCEHLWRWLSSLDLCASLDVDALIRSWPLLPAVAGVARSRVLVRAYSPRLSLVSSASTLPVAVVDALLAAGIAILDEDVVSAQSLEKCCPGRAFPSTASGVAQALAGCKTEDGMIDWEMNADAHCASLREWFSSCVLRDAPSIDAVRKLPIFKAVSIDQQRMIAVDDGAALPPGSIDSALLSLASKKTLIFETPDATSRRLLRMLNASDSMKVADIVVAALPGFALLSEGKEDREIKQGAAKAMLALLRDLRQLIPSGNNDLGVVAQSLASTAFVPTRGNAFARPSELYDPTSPVLQDLLEDGCFPATDDQISLDALRKLGLRTELDRSGALASARSTHALAVKADDDPSLERDARCRGAALMRALDRDRLVDDDEDEQFGVELRSLRWVPTLLDDAEDETLDALAPRPFEMKGAAYLCRVRSPSESRPVADAWLCSAVVGLVARRNTPRCDSLLRALAWSDDVDAEVVACQLKALDRTFARLFDQKLDEESDSISVRSPRHDDDGLLEKFCRQMTTVAPTIYRVLDHARLASSQSFERAAQMIRDDQISWIWLGAGFAPSRHVALEAEEYRGVLAGRTLRERALKLQDRPLHEVPYVMTSFRQLAEVLGVKSHFETSDYADALERLSDRTKSSYLNDEDLALASGLVAAVAEGTPTSTVTVLIPDTLRRLAPAKALIYDNAPWLSASVKAEWMRAQGASSSLVHRESFCHASIPEEVASILGVRSLRSLLLSNEHATQSIPCPSLESMSLQDESVAILDLFALADSFGSKSVTLVVDERHHHVGSLLSPAFASIQGPALVFYFEHDTQLHTDDLVRALHVDANKDLATEQAIDGRSSENEQGMGATLPPPRLRKPLVGCGLSASFSFTDCLVVLAGDILHLFNPNGEFLADGDDSNESRGRRYALADGELARKFSDQFAPFGSLPFGVSPDKGCVTGTIVRLPLKRGVFFDDNNALDQGALLKVIKVAETHSSRSLVFAETLSFVGAHRFVGDAMLPLFSSSRRDTKLVDCVGLDASKGPPTNDARAPRRRMSKLSKAWRRMSGSKMQKFFTATIFGSSSKSVNDSGGVPSATWSPPRTVVEFEITCVRFAATEANDDEAISQKYLWLSCSIAAPTKRVRELTDDPAVAAAIGRPYTDTPVVSVAARIDDVEMETKLGAIFCAGAESGVDASATIPFLSVDAPFALESERPGRLTEDSRVERRLIHHQIVHGGATDKQKSSHQDLDSKEKDDAHSPEDAKLSVLTQWNEALWTAALVEVVPEFLGQLLGRLGQRPEQRLYRNYWPRLATRRDVDSLSCHTPLAAQRAAQRLCSEPLFLSTRTGDFGLASSGILRASPLPIGVEALLRPRIPLLQVPASVAVDLAAAFSNNSAPEVVPIGAAERFLEALGGAMSPSVGPVKLATSATLRKIFGRESKAALALEISRDGAPVRLATQLLKLCAADGIEAWENDSAVCRRRRQQCWAEIAPLPLLPLSARGDANAPRGKSAVVASFAEGRGVLATTRQIELCNGNARSSSMLNTRFVDPAAIRACPELLGDGPLASEFAVAVGLDRFNAVLFANELRSLLPSSWLSMNGDFIEEWSEDDFPSGSALWLRDFWAEVSISNLEALFDRFALLPLRDGRLAKCSYRSSLVASLAVPPNMEIAANLDELESMRKSEEVAKSLANAEIDRAHDDLDRARYLQIGEDLEEACTDKSDPAEASANSADAPAAEYEDSEPLGQSLAAPTSAVGDARLIQVVGRLRLPVLELAWWPKAQREAVARSLSEGGLASRVLRCLAENASQIDWNAATNEEKEWMLGLFANEAGGTYRQRLRELPLFHTLGGRKVDLVPRADRASLAALALGVKEKLQQIAPTGWTPTEEVLDPLSHVELDLIIEAGVPRLDLPNALARLVVPYIATYTDESKLRSLLTLIVEEWENSNSSFSRSIELRNVLSTSSFVPTGSSSSLISGTINDTGALVIVGSMTLARPDKLLDPSVEELAEACGLEDENGSLFFPAVECRSPSWLRMLRDLGLRRALDPATFLAAAELAAEKRESRRSRQLLKHLRVDFERQQASQRTLSSDTSLLNSLGNIPFVPVTVYDARGEMVAGFSSLTESAVYNDRAVCWTSTPIIAHTDTPPRLLWSTLGLKSPPTEPKVLAHLRNLGMGRAEFDRAFSAVERSNDGSIGVVDAFSAMYAFLADSWPRLSPRIKQALPSLSCIPVAEDQERGPWLALSPSSRRVFLELPDDAKRLRLAPLVYAVPTALCARHAAFLREELKVAVSPTSAEYAELLRRLDAGRRLDPNELAAAVRLVELLAGSGLRAHRGVVIPDEMGRLLDAKTLVVDDDPELRIRLSRRLNVAHPRLSSKACELLGVQNLSSIVSEKLAEESMATLSGERYDRLAHLLTSPQFARAIGELVAHHKSYYSPDDDERDTTTAKLASLRIIPVNNIRTELIVPKRFLDEDESTMAVSNTPAAFADGACLYVAQPDNALGVADALCTYLGIPRPRLARPIADLIFYNDDTISSVVESNTSLRRSALRRGSPGALLDDIDAKCLALAPLRRFAPGEIVAFLHKNDECVYAKVEGGRGDESVPLDIPTLRLLVGPGDVQDVPATRVYVIQGSPSNSAPQTQRAPAPGRDAHQEARRDAVNLDEETKVDDDEGPIARTELLVAVDDLLRRAGLPPLASEKRALLEQLAEAKIAAAQANNAATRAQSEAAEAVESQRRLRRARSNVPEFECPITREQMVDPVIASDGFTYERDAISRWLSSRGTSPQTNAPLASRNLVPNRALKALIQAHNARERDENAQANSDDDPDNILAM